MKQPIRPTPAPTKMEDRMIQPVGDWRRGFSTSVCLPFEDRCHDAFLRAAKAQEATPEI